MQLQKSAKYYILSCRAYISNSYTSDIYLQPNVMNVWTFWFLSVIMSGQGSLFLRAKCLIKISMIMLLFLQLAMYV